MWQAGQAELHNRYHRLLQDLRLTWVPILIEAIAAWLMANILESDARQVIEQFLDSLEILVPKSLPYRPMTPNRQCCPFIRGR